MQRCPLCSRNDVIYQDGEITLVEKNSQRHLCSENDKFRLSFSNGSYSNFILNTLFCVDYFSLPTDPTVVSTKPQSSLRTLKTTSTFHMTTLITEKQGMTCNLPVCVIAESSAKLIKAGRDLLKKSGDSTSKSSLFQYSQVRTVYYPWS